MPSHITYATTPNRDSFELGSLADSSSHSGSVRSSLSSDPGISSSRRLSLASERSEPIQAQFSRPRQQRSWSVSSAFDYNTHLVPLSSSSDAQYHQLGGSTTISTGNPVGGLEKQKTLSFLNGLSLVIGVQIGSGIFSSPSQVNNHVPSPGAALVIWAIAGLLAWTGAASYAELGGAIPLNGGSGVYLRHCYGELAAFLFSWAAVIVLKPGGAAIVAIISGEYINRVIYGSFGADHDSPLPGQWANKATAVTCFLIVTVLNIISTRLATRLSDGMMFLKVGTLLAITVVGIIVALTGLNGDGKGASTEWRELSWFEPRTGNQAATKVGEGVSIMGELGEYAIALYAGLWAFDGWDNVNYVTGEMRNPTRDLPRVIHSGMPIVIISYLLANASYYFVLPGKVVSSSNTIAVAFGTKVFGTAGGVVLAIAVSLSCFGALNASTFTSGRIVYVAGKEGYIPAIFGTLGFRSSTLISSQTRHQRPLREFSNPSFLGKFKALFLRLRPSEDGVSPWSKTPVYAMLLNAAFTLAYILVGEFGTLLTFYGVAGYSFYFLTVLGLIVLRIREPSLDRPYKTWISTPLIFCCVSLFLISRSVFSSPLETLFVCAFVAAGVPVYFVQVQGWRPFGNK